MKCCSFSLRIVYIILLCVYSLTCFAEDECKYYDRHVILLVDESPGGQSEAMGREIIEMLKYGRYFSKDNSFEPIDSDKDELSVYVFGLTGESREMLNREIVNRSLRPSEFFNSLTKRLIYRRVSLRGSKKTLDEFCNDYLQSLFNGQDPLRKEMNKTANKRPITLSQYAQECFLSRLSTDLKEEAENVPAREYILIMVSDFRSGMYDKSSSSDLERIRELAGYKNEYVKQFEDDCKNVKEGLNIIEYNDIKLNDGGKDFAAIIYHIIPDALLNTSAYLAKGLKLSQKSFLGSKYMVSDISIAFPHSEDNFPVEKIVMWALNNDGLHTEQKIWGKNDILHWYNKESQTYNIKNVSNYDLRSSIGKNDSVTFVFSLIGESKSSNGCVLLPFAIEARQVVNQGAITIRPAPTKTYLLIIAIILIVAIFLWWLIRKIRHKLGFNTPGYVEVNVWPISNSRYMDVSDMKVVNYDCWYYVGRSDTSRNIQITGKMSYNPPRNAKQFRTRVEYRIEDPTGHKVFSFRPDGCESNGAFKQLNTWYTAKVDDKGEFEILCTAFIRDGQAPNFTAVRDNILKMKVVVRMSLLDSSGSVVALEKAKAEKYYSFIVRQEIENSDLWVAFDPGTTGSCVAYGQGGNPDEKDAILLARDKYQDMSGNWHERVVFPSKIRITDNSTLFDPKMNVDNAQEYTNGTAGDFYFGNEAEIYTGRNTFQSIKKLLGYTDKQEIVSRNGIKTRKLTGEDLAYLLLRGLCNHFEIHLKSDESQKAAGMRDAFFGGNYNPEDAIFQPSRAIVAVPNNYTMVKVQAMVNTVKRTNLFKEVHYIYESEGVLMTYLQHNWSRLEKVENKLIVVFDMGGATINATAFKIKVTRGDNQGTSYIHNVCVDTVAKIGFGVGGDDIDFAFIQIVLSAPKVKDVIGNKEDFMRLHKKGLIDMARRLKFDHIEKQNHPNKRSNANVLKSSDTLCTYLNTTFSNWKHTLNVDEAEDRRGVYDYITKALNSNSSRSMMEKYVMSKVSDAINELFMGMPDDVYGSEVELILSGRSTLYPGIKDRVLKTINDTARFSCREEWHGFTKANDEVDDEEVKSCVANGACWFAMFSKLITLRHNILTSTLGYMDMVADKSSFVPLLSRNMPFDEYGKCKLAEPKAPLYPLLNTVKFLQMFGSNFDEIIEKKINHKYDTLLTVLPASIHGNITGINIEVDDKNNFSYCIDVAGQPSIRGSYVISDNDIASDNTEAYSFAALQSVDDTTGENASPTGPRRF